MTSRDVLVNFKGRFDDLHRATQAVIDELRQVGRALGELNRFSESMGQFKAGKALERDFANTKTTVEALLVKLERLRELQAQIDKRAVTAAAGPQAEIQKIDKQIERNKASAKSEAEKAKKELELIAAREAAAKRLAAAQRQTIGPIEGVIAQPRTPKGTMGIIGSAEIAAEILKTERTLEEQIAAAEIRRAGARQALTGLMEHDLDLQERVLSNVTGQVFMQERLLRIRRGDVLKEVLEERLRLLQANEEAIQKNISALEQSALVQLGTRKADKITRERSTQDKIARDAVAELQQLERELARNRAQLAKAQASNSKSVNRLAAEEVALLERREAATKRLADAQRRLIKPTQDIQAALDLGGVGDLMDRLRSQAAATRQAQVGLTPATVSPELLKMVARFEAIDRQLVLIRGNTAKENELLREQEQLVAAIERERAEAPARGVEAVESEEDFRQRQLANMPKLERAFIGAFDDMGRRFQATLQFAISGALIFGAQQLARRFLETAIEVERAFADIGTAFEFDIEAGRDTLEFQTQLQQIRLRVLSLADEFNVLPTEANKAAFSMVARFGDVNDAMVALRAQLLATKISTIDQAEALRALSSVAENFAAASLSVDDGLTVQEKLFRREQAAVLNYGKALDIATTLQQQFGVEVEDTLEGVSRLAPTFAKMGFSMEQTASIVASIGRELGLAGSSVADSVNRSLGQLVEPSTRDALLELAAANANLTLTFDDFASGERALATLVEQFRNLEEIDPGTAFQVLNILGQRRELDVVAALFNTTELQAAMNEALEEAAGSAAKRFTILSQTISERLASIASGFERLAQNFTELGFLEPIKLAVAAFDELLKKTNQFLETVSQIITELGALGTVLKAAVALTLARQTITRLAGLIANTAKFGATAFARTAAASAARGGVGTLISGAASTVAGELTLLATQVKNNRIGLFALTRGLWASVVAFATHTKTVIADTINQALATGVARLTSRFPKLDAALSGFTASVMSGKTTYAALLGKLGLLAGVVIGAVAAFHGFQDAMTAVESAVRGFRNAMTSAAAQARRERQENPEDFPVDESFRRRVLELTEQNLAQQSAELDTFFERLLLGAVSMTERSQQGVAELREIIKQIQGGELTVMQGFELSQLVPGTQEFIDRRDRELTRLRIASAIKEMMQEAIAAGVTTVSFGSLADVGIGELPPGRAFMDEAQALLNDVIRATEQVDVENAIAGLDALGASWVELQDSLSGTLESIEGTAKTAADRADDVKRSFGVGRVSRATLIRELRVAEQTVREQGRQALQSKTAGAGERARELFQLADQLLVDLLQAELEVFDIDLMRADLIRSSAGKLQAQLAIYQQQLKKLQESGTEDEIARKLIQIAQTTEELAELYRERAISIAQGTVDVARTDAEWFAAQDILIAALRHAAIQAIDTLDPQIQTDATNAWKKAELDRLERFIDVGKRTRIAQARLNGPINDKINILNAQIAAINFELANEVDPLKQMELMVQLRETLASRMQEEIARMQAYVEVQAGATDQILLLKGSIVVATAEVAAAADAFGTLSTEFNSAKAKLADLKSQLGNALLSLEDINRRLGSDLSNTFQQAIFDLQLIAGKLQAPDLGDLEKAQLMLEQQRAEMAAEQAFFSTELFNLRFLSETGQLGTGAYVSALQSLLSQVDTTTQQGKEIFLEIQSLIDGMTEDVSDMAFNVPTAIRLPTLFEVRRALAADQLGVNYMDNRQLDISINVRDATDVEELVQILATSIGATITPTAGRYATGGAGITLGGF